MPKDLFSAQASAYARCRPTYPPELIEFVAHLSERRQCLGDGLGRIVRAYCGERRMRVLSE